MVFARFRWVCRFLLVFVGFRWCAHGRPGGAGAPKSPFSCSPHRLVARTSRRGRDNPGATPGADTQTLRNCRKGWGAKALKSTNELRALCIGMLQTACFYHVLHSSGRVAAPHNHSEFGAVGTDAKHCKKHRACAISTHRAGVSCTSCAGDLGAQRNRRSLAKTTKSSYCCHYNAIRACNVS